MKFSHEFQAALAQDGYPSHWAKSAVAYSQLKKVIKKLKVELEAQGLDTATLKRLLANSEIYTKEDNGDAAAVSLQYKFDSDADFRPTLTLLFKNTTTVDANLSQGSRMYLKNLLFKELQPSSSCAPGGEKGMDSCQKSNSVSDIDKQGATNGTSPVRLVEVPLTYDADFFGLLQEDVTTLDTFQAREQEALATDITQLSSVIRLLTKVSRFSKSDLYRWRELYVHNLSDMYFLSSMSHEHVL
jgi:E3 ubiquitin-protein ligase BAH